MIEQLPPSDIVPGISPVAIDYDWARGEIDRLLAKLATCSPVVIRVGGLLNLYQGAEVRVRTNDAQIMWDYLNENLPRGTKVRWFVLPAQTPLSVEALAPLNPS